MPISEKTEKDLNFDDLAGPVKKMVIPQHGPQNNLTELLRTQKYQNGLLRSSYENATPNLCWVFFALLGVLCNL